jgi:hypothetical protein
VERRSGFSLKGIFAPKKVGCIRTSSEPEREVDGLVTHFAKHLSFVFCVGGRSKKRATHYNTLLFVVLFFGNG